MIPHRQGIVNVPKGSGLHHLTNPRHRVPSLNGLLLSQDLKTAVTKICCFLDRDLTEADINKIVEKATFKNMKNDRKANYEFIPEDILKKGQFLRKGQALYSHSVSITVLI